MTITTTANDGERQHRAARNALVFFFFPFTRRFAATYCAVSPVLRCARRLRPFVPVSRLFGLVQLEADRHVPRLILQRMLRHASCIATASRVALAIRQRRSVYSFIHYFLTKGNILIFVYRDRDALLINMLYE